MYEKGCLTTLLMFCLPEPSRGTQLLFKSGKPVLNLAGFELPLPDLDYRGIKIHCPDIMQPEKELSCVLRPELPVPRNLKACLIKEMVISRHPVDDRYSDFNSETEDLLLRIASSGKKSKNTHKMPAKAIIDRLKHSRYTSKKAADFLLVMSGQLSAWNFLSGTGDSISVVYFRTIEDRFLKHPAIWSVSITSWEPHSDKRKISGLLNSYKYQHDSFFLGYMADIAIKYNKKTRRDFQKIKEKISRIQVLRARLHTTPTIIEELSTVIQVEPN